MKDINEAFGEDDFGLARHGSELDDPEAGMKPGFKKAVSYTHLQPTRPY